MNYNRFNLDEGLATSLAKIIGQNEEEKYVCEVVSCTIPKHTERVFRSTIPFNSLGGGYNGLSGPVIRDLEEKNGKYVYETIPEEVCQFFIVMEKSYYPTFSRLSFKSKEEVEQILENLCIVFAEYNSVINSNKFSEKFPYLAHFFQLLNEWRINNGSVKVDDDVLEKYTSEIVPIKEPALSKAKALKI